MGRYDSASTAIDRLSVRTFVQGYVQTFYKNYKTMTISRGQ